MSTRNFGRLLHDLSLREADEPPLLVRRTARLSSRRTSTASAPAAVVSLPARRRLATLGIIAATLTFAILWFVRSEKFEPPASAPIVAAFSPSTSSIISFAPQTGEPPTTDVSPASEVAESPRSEPPREKAFEYAAARAIVKASQRRTNVAASASTSPRLFPQRSSDELLHELSITGRDVGSQPLMAVSVAKPASKHDRPTAESAGSRYVAKMLSARPSLFGLPFRGESDCHVDPDRIGSMIATSQEFGSALLRETGSRGPSFDVDGVIRGMLRDGPVWRHPYALPTLAQMLQVKDESVRLELVELLAAAPGPEASRALVDRALFDLSDQVRNAANAALAMRPLDEFRDRLLEGFRYPWPEAARHAAETAAAIDAAELIPPLKALLDAPDPAAPRRASGQGWVRSELVRMNHLGNCSVCHAKLPANAANDGTHEGFAAPMPKYGEPLFVAYYGHPVFVAGEAIRADVVYVQQDFSVIHRTSAFEPWPVEQRYDYLVQERRLSEPEAAAAERNQAAATAASKKKLYPQRDAVVAALAFLDRPER